MDQFKSSAVVTEETQQFTLEVQPSLLPFLKAAKVVSVAEITEEANQKDPLKVAETGVPAFLRGLLQFREKHGDN